jgi:NAD(P)-dependent dehydrogenase (short-subunit alcohol dehydrogenase family)
LAQEDFSMGKLDGKVAIITGAAGGIGKATAELFVKEGARVFLVDRDEGKLAALKQALGSGAAFACADVSREEDAVRYVRGCVSAFGGVDVLFANAGIEGSVCPVTSLATEVFDNVLAVNVRGVFLGIKYAAPEIEKRGGGSIVITASVAALRGSAGLSAYVTSKHALTGLARTAALELASAKIRVNTVNPGPVDNRMMRSIEEQASPGHAAEVKRGFESQVALGRYATNEDVGGMVLFLASSDASYCTGASFVVDGGFTAH